MSSIKARAEQLGIVLPEPPVPSARYVPWKKSMGHVWISGQVSDDGDGGIKGVVGREIDLQCAVEAARLCALRIVAQLANAVDDDMDQVKQIVRVTGYVQAADDFMLIPQVIDGCSEILTKMFGEYGQHSRSSVGVRCLPRGFAVECDAVVEYRTA